MSLVLVLRKTCRLNVDNATYNKQYLGELFMLPYNRKVLTTLFIPNLML